MKRVVILLTLLFMGTAQVSLACRCGKLPGRGKAFRGFQVVVAVTVLEVLPPDTLDQFVNANGDTVPLIAAYGRTKRLRIERVYKGTFTSDTIMMAPVDSNCEMDMETGKSYLIYADWSGGMLFTNGCTRSGFLAGHRDLKFLERKSRSK